MNRAQVLKLLEDVRSGKVTPGQAVDAVSGVRPEDMGFAVADHGRAARCGFPEVIFAEGKTPVQVATIAEAIVRRSGRLLCTRADRPAFDAVSERVPDARYAPDARVIYLDPDADEPGVGHVQIVTAGTSDIPVAEEARITASVMGARVVTRYDVGVAGLHRLLEHLDELRAARVVVVVAGMEGALPSVVGGLVDRPVVAVPTHVGYGASLGGLTALLGMLNSCAANVTVVNIDNGFGAGYVAALINRDHASPETTETNAQQPVDGGPSRGQE